MDRDHNGFLSDWERDADGDGIPNMDEGGNKDEARLPPGSSDSDPDYHDYGVFTSAYVDLASKQSAEPELLCAGINQVPYYCTDALQPTAIDTQKIDSLDWLSRRLRRRRHPRRRRRLRPRRRRQPGRVPAGDRPAAVPAPLRADQPLLPERRRAPVPRSAARTPTATASPTRDDTDDDGDRLPDDLERQLGTDPLRADTDGDGVTDGFEYYSALDLNSAARCPTRASGPTRTRSTRPTAPPTSTATA